MSSLTLPPAARQSSVQIEEVVDEKASEPARAVSPQQPAAQAQQSELQQQNEALQKRLDELLQAFQEDSKKCVELDNKRTVIKDNLVTATDELLAAERKRTQSFSDLSDFRLSVADRNVRFLQQQLNLKQEGK